MSKMIEVTMCLRCPKFHQGSSSAPGVKGRPDLCALAARELAYGEWGNRVPDWCPLPDAPAVVNAGDKLGPGEAPPYHPLPLNHPIFADDPSPQPAAPFIGSKSIVISVAHPDGGSTTIEAAPDLKLRSVTVLRKPSGEETVISFPIGGGFEFKTTIQAGGGGDGHCQRNAGPFVKGEGESK